MIFAIKICDRQYMNKFFGGYCGGATPVSISNTVVKSSSAYGTAKVTLWESGSLPETNLAIGRSQVVRQWVLVP